MAAKKTPQKAAPKKGQKNTPSITARIDRMVDYEGSSVRAIASASIAGAFAIHGIKVLDSEKGLFVSMPQTKYEKDGKMQYSDIFHPITAESRAELNNTVLAAYEQKLQEEEAQEMDEPEETQETAIGQTM